MKTIRRQRILAILVAVAVIASVFAFALPVQATNGVKTQMVVCLDGSGSISDSNWNVMRQGLAAAIADPACVPQDGSVELGINKFGYSNPPHAQVVVPMTVIDSQATANSIAAIVAATSKPDGWTPTAAAIDQATAMMTGSSNFSIATRHIINISTDGVPQDPTGTTIPRAQAIAARDAAIAAGITGIHAEAIGVAPADVEWMRANIVYPQPGVTVYPPNPLPDPNVNGFVLVIGDFTDYADAICAKFKALVQLQLVLTPDEASNPVNTIHEVTATLTDSEGNPIAGQTVDFTIIAGPNAGKTGSAVTDADGKATWSYQDTNASDGETDTIQATSGDVTSNTVSKTWFEQQAVPSIGFWGIVATVAVLGLFGVLMLHRRQIRMTA